MTESQVTVVPAPLWRRLTAMLYDGLIVIALLMFATAIVLPFNQGDAFSAGNVLLQLYLALVILGFFVVFWRFGGQTLGMRAWKIKITNSRSNSPPSFAQLVVRAVVAVPALLLGGLGLWWMLIDGEKRALHDRASQTHLVVHDA